MTLMDEHKKLFNLTYFEKFLDLEKLWFNRLLIHFILLREIVKTNFNEEFWFILNEVDV